MKRLFLFLIPLLFTSVFLSSPTTILAATTSPGLLHGINCGLSSMLTVTAYNEANTPNDVCIQDRQCKNPQNQFAFLGGKLPCPDAQGNVYSPGVLGTQGKVVATLFQNQISSQEYVADILDNIGIPTVSRAYAQSTGGGTGYNAMKPFLEFWKVFRNLAYSLYIIMFVVVGIMIMLRTKVNAQTIITIQTALPNLLITLLLITFSYAIVGFMIDLMYFLIYFVVYLIASAGVIDASKSITRLMSYSAWSVVFEGRNSIISAITSSLQGILGSLGTGGVGLVGGGLSALDNGVQMLTLGMVSPLYLFITVSFVIAMLKLIVALIKSYVMLIVQTITAPVQILMNAMPGSKAFSTWLKTTASYLIPFPVAAAMFIFAAVLIGNPTNAIYANDWWPGNSGPAGAGHQNPFGVTDIVGRENVWLPPFTLTDSFGATANPDNLNILALIGFFIFLMTPSAVKMAQEWMQVKESPYAAEAFKGFAGVVTTGVGYPTGMIKQARSLREQRQIQEYGATKYAEAADKLQKEGHNSNRQVNR
ncbi:MAG: hypothetical protein WCG44_01430 [bacterium]